MSPRSSLKSACESAFVGRDLQAGEALGRVEPSLGDRGVDDAADGGCTGFQSRSDLLVRKSGNKEVKNALPPLEVFGPALFRQGARLVTLRGARLVGLRGGCGFLGHAESSGAAGSADKRQTTTGFAGRQEIVLVLFDTPKGSGSV